MTKWTASASRKRICTIWTKSFVRFENETLLIRVTNLKTIFFLDVTNSRRGIRYLLKNDSNQYKYISGSEMKWRYVDLLINFYEKNQPKIDIRSFKGKLKSSNKYSNKITNWNLTFHLSGRMKDPKIVIQKVAKFEKRVNVVNAGAASAVSANVVTVNAEAANTSAERNVVIDDVAVDSVAANPLAVINVPVGDVAIDAVAADTLAENNVAIDGVSVNAKVANAMRKFRRNTAYLEKKSTAVPLNAKGRKRRQSMCLMDDIKENQGKKVVCRGGNIAREGILVDLSNEPSTSAGPAGPSKPSSNLQRIFDDLQGINFNTKVDRQLPALIPIKVKKPTLAAQIILNVLNANGEMIDENELRYSGESD